MKSGKYKPGIIVMSADTDDQFNWFSDGWNTIKKSGTREAQELMAKARKAIGDSADVPDAIKLLTEAGFDVRRK